MLQRRALTCLISALFINGCGSDSVTNITIIEAPKSPQAPLVFSAATQSYYIEETPEANRISGGSGAGNLIYTSSNSDIATVDTDTGIVTLLDDGTVTITATKAGDDIYDATSASYSLNVSKYDRWYNSQWQFAEQEYVVALAENESAGNIFKPTNRQPFATNLITIDGNLPASADALDPNDFNPNNTATYNASTSLIIYDNLGFSHLMAVYFIKDANSSPNNWLITVSLDNEFYDFANSDGTDPSPPVASAGSYDNYVGFNTQLPFANHTVTQSGIWSTRLRFSSGGDLLSVETPDGISFLEGASNLTFATTTPFFGLSTGADRSQTVSFNITLDTTGITHDGITQLATPFDIGRLEQNGLGIGDLNPALVSYHSGDTNIALVNENTGWLTLISNGETEITATIAEDDYYAETQISYRLIVQ